MIKLLKTDYVERCINKTIKTMCMISTWLEFQLTTSLEIHILEQGSSISLLKFLLAKKESFSLLMTTMKSLTTALSQMLWDLLYLILTYQKRIKRSSCSIWIKCSTMIWEKLINYTLKILAIIFLQLYKCKTRAG